MTKELCNICGDGYLHEQVVYEHVEYKGENSEIPLMYSVCAACGSEQATSRHLRENKRNITAFKKRVDGLLSGEEVRDLRKSLRLSQGKAAQIFGGGPVAFSKYESNDVIQSEAMDKLLRLVRIHPEILEYLDDSLKDTEAVQRKRRRTTFLGYCAWVSVNSMYAERRRPIIRVIRRFQGHREPVWHRAA